VDVADHHNFHNKVVSAANQNLYEFSSLKAAPALRATSDPSSFLDDRMPIFSVNYFGFSAQYQA
jgi:hypothetical protein